MKAFISYSHQDEWALDELHKHLALLRREGKITAWFDREILPGSNIHIEISTNLVDSDLFLALVSPDFINSDYCYDKEMIKALELHKEGQLTVIPIIVEPCEWIKSPLSDLLALPKDGIAISTWTNKNTAWLDVVTGIRSIIENNVSTPVASKSSPPSNNPLSVARYKAKKDFDDIDKIHFKEKIFNQLKEFFRKAVAELDSIKGFKGSYTDIDAYTFTATIINRNLQNGTAHITVFINRESYGIGDISYSEDRPGTTRTTNGWFSVQNNDYELFLTSNIGWITQSEEKITNGEIAAKLLWERFIQRAGISYAD
ncbi:MAG: toll/interleukin-1 receptor domain-containing protein [Emcibacteraceae bacterium]